MQNRTTPEHSTWAILALLRFGLACVVVSTHFVWFTGPGHPLLVLAPFDALAAVLGFLFVSGYSIAHSLRRRPDGFYARRLVRIYPLYLLSIVLAVVPFVFNGHQTIVTVDHEIVPPKLIGLASNLLFGQTFVSGPLAPNAVVWSLSVEVACYLAAPLLLRRGPRVILALIAVSAAAYVVYPHTGLGHYASLKFGLPLLFLAWAWLAGFIYQLHRSSVRATAAFVGISVILTVLNQVSLGWGVLTTALSVMTIALAPFIRVPVTLARGMTFLGDVSYPLYLVHVPAAALAWWLHVRNPYALLAAAVAASVVCLGLDNALHWALRANRRPEIVPTPA